jgi:hypothetical protein
MLRLVYLAILDEIIITQKTYPFNFNTLVYYLKKMTILFWNSILLYLILILVRTDKCKRRPV